jgi:hypothetical protein
MREGHGPSKEVAALDQGELLRLGAILLDQRKPSKGLGNLNSRHLSFPIASDLAAVSGSTSGLLLRLSAHSFVCPQRADVQVARSPAFDSKVQTWEIFEFSRAHPQEKRPHHRFVR